MAAPGMTEEQYLEMLRRSTGSIAGGLGAAAGGSAAPGGTVQPVAATTAQANVQPMSLPNYSADATEPAPDATGDVAKDAAAGGAAAGPWGAVIGAALGLVNANLAKKARLRSEQNARLAAADNRVFDLRKEQIAAPGRANARESAGIQDLLNVLSRSVR